MEWNKPWTKPSAAGVYRVQVPVPASDRAEAIEERYARWTGDYWCSWATTIKRAAMCQWRGPSAGYLWALL